MMPLVDVTKGWQVFKGQDLVYGITGLMTYFPLCCSTGVLKGVGAQPITETIHKPTIDKPSAYAILSDDAIENIETATYIYEIIRQTPTNCCYPFPVEVASWTSLSLCLAKCVKGTDEHGPGAYSGYKAAQITMFDRTQEDKDPKKGFKFTYNMTYSVDHFIQWLKLQNGALGEVLVSTPKPGGHGAEVYGAIFTPDIKALKKFNKDHIDLVRNQVLAASKYYQKYKKIAGTQW